MNGRIRVTLIAIMVLGMVLTGCSNAGKASESNERTVIVCTIFPQYDWVRNIIAGHEDKYDVRLLIDDGTDSHSFQPTVKDIALMNSCDMLIYNGGESDEWIEDVLENVSSSTDASSDNATVYNKVNGINLSNFLEGRLKEEEIIEGMQVRGEDHEEYLIDEANQQDGEHIASEVNEAEYDEHIWLSLGNAMLLTEKIAEEIAQLDPDNAQDYRVNAAAYIKKLEELEARYIPRICDATYDTLLFADRFPFRYFVEDYDLNYYAAFLGCSAETEASFDTVIFLANKLDELSLPVVFIIENSSDDLAKTVINASNNKNADILMLDSMQSVTAEEIDKGASYINKMEYNLEMLVRATN